MKGRDKMSSRKLLSHDVVLDYEDPAANPKHDPRGKKGGGGRNKWLQITPNFEHQAVKANTPEEFVLQYHRIVSGIFLFPYSITASFRLRVWGVELYYASCKILLYGYNKTIKVLSRLRYSFNSFVRFSSHIKANSFIVSLFKIFYIIKFIQ